MSSRLCFCILCKGRVLLSSYQIKQHVKIYGLGDAKSATGRSTAEKLRADEGDSSSESSSDRESEKEECSFTSAVVKGTSKSAAGPSVAKKSRVDKSASSNSSCDRESEKEDCCSSGSESESLRHVEHLEDACMVDETPGEASDGDAYPSINRDDLKDSDLGNIEVYLEGLHTIPHTDSEETDSSDSDTEDSSSGSESEENGIDPLNDESNADALDITAAILSGKVSNDVGKAIAESPALHSSLPNCTVFETVAYLFDWFSAHPSLSKEAFSKNLQLWHSLLPEGNLLPTSYQEAYKIIRPYLLPEIVFHVCINDCIIYRGDYKDSVSCPKCNEPRFLVKNIPRRTFHYLPLGPKIIRSYGTEEISCILQSHGRQIGEVTDRGIMRDIHDSPKWKEAFSTSGTFKGDPRGVALSLCLDGLNPWSKNKSNYSMWPIVLAQLNLPRNVRYHFANLLLLGIIPSQAQGKEPKNLDPFLEVLVDEILFLSSCKVYDAYRKAPFDVKVDIMIYVLDYQGLGKVFSLTGTGSYRGCGWCMQRGQYCQHLKKVVYPGNRRFLPTDHSLRKDSQNFPEHLEETRERPPQRSFHQDAWFHKAHGNAKNNAQSTRIALGTGCRGMPVLAKNPKFDRVEQTVPDTMHTVAVQVKHLINCIAMKAPEDSLAVRLQEKSLGRFEQSWPNAASSTSHDGTCEKSSMGSKKKKKSDRETTSLPTAPFGLTKTKMEEADQCAKEIRVPAGDKFRPGPIFSRISRLNSHEWKEVAARGILKYLLRDMLGDEQRESLVLFVDAIAALCAPFHEEAKIPVLKEQMDVALARVERDFPLSLQVITNHILHHVPEGIEKFGPVHGTWMFPYERFNSWLCRRALNRRHPEATILRTYQIYEWCHFVKMSGKMKSKLPFELPCEGGDNLMPSSTMQGSTQGTTELSKEELRHMEEVYKEEVMEFKTLWTIYLMEKDLARKHGKLKKFPKFPNWKPEGSQFSSDLHSSILGGLLPTAVTYQHYVSEAKQHSRSFVYISTQHPSKKPTIAFYRPPFEYSSGCSTSCPSAPCFGVIDKIYQHSFAQQVFMWAVVRFYRKPNFIPSCGLWCCDGSFGKTAPVLLSRLSYPLTTAVDEKRQIWFLDA